MFNFHFISLERRILDFKVDNYSLINCLVFTYYFVNKLITVTSRVIQPEIAANLYYPGLLARGPPCNFLPFRLQRSHNFRAWSQSITRNDRAYHLFMPVHKLVTNSIDDYKQNFGHY